MKKQIKTGLILCISIIAIGLSACKKEKDDPNITYLSFNKTTNNTAVPSMTIDSIDVNKDGIIDLIFGTFRQSADTQYVQFEGSYIAFAVNDAAQYIDAHFVKLFSKDEMPALYNELTENYNTSEYFGAKIGASSFGTDGKGEVYLAFGMKPEDSSDDIYYGWLRINIAADYSTVKIMDGAISDVANKTIAIGAK